MVTFSGLFRIFLIVCVSFITIFVVEACCSLFNIEEDLRKMRIKAQLDIEGLKPIGNRSKWALVFSIIMPGVIIALGFIFCGGLNT